MYNIVGHKINYERDFVLIIIIIIMMHGQKIMKSQAVSHAVCIPHYSP